MKKPFWESGEDIVAWFKGKSPEELDVIEHGGQTFYSEVLHRKSPQDEQAEHAKLRVRTPGALDRARARLQALIWVRELALEEGYKTPEVLTIAEAEAIYGPVYFDQLDTICIISQVAVEHDQPGEPFFRPEMLAKNYSMTSLMALWDRICFYANHEDVRVHDVDEDMFLAIVAAIDQHKNITPLLALDGYLRDKAVTIMASRLSSFLTPKSSLPSTAKSTATPAG